MLSLLPPPSNTAWVLLAETCVTSKPYAACGFALSTDGPMCRSATGWGHRWLARMSDRGGIRRGGPIASPSVRANDCGTRNTLDEGPDPVGPSSPLDQGGRASLA